MNLNTLAHLIRPDVTTCEVVFGNNHAKRYVFKITTALAKQLDQGSEVICSTCNGTRTAFIYNIHDESRIDPEDDVDYQWVFQIVDIDAKDRQEQVEAQIAMKLKDRRKLSQRQQALAALGITDPEEFIQTLPTPQKRESTRTPLFKE